MKPKTVIFCNQKGGVGKTTASRNLGYYLAASGYKVLLIDLDGQGNLSKSFFDKERIGSGVYEAFESGDVHICAVSDTLHLLAADDKLIALERQLVGDVEGYTKLKDLLEREEFGRYDFIFMDSPPSLGMLTNNGLAACEYLLVPLSPKLYSMQGTNTLLNNVQKIRKTYNPDLKILGFLVNDHDRRLLIERQIIHEIRESLRDKVFGPTVSHCVKMEESIALGVGITSMKEKAAAKVREEVEAVGKEFLGRLYG